MFVRYIDMKKLFAFVILAAIVAGCAKLAKPGPEELAGKAAVQYYEYLKDGNCEAFVDGTYREKTLRANLRAELIESAQMYKGRLDKKHQGIADVELKNAVADTSLHVASVYLNLGFGDGTTETILVPMVEKEELWYMR